MFYIKRPNSFDIIDVKLDKLNYPSSGNWVCTLDVLDIEESFIEKEFIYINNDEIKLTFYGQVRKINTTPTNTKLIITGISLSDDKIKKSKQYLDSTFYSCMKTITTDIMFNCLDFALSYWTSKESSKLDFISKLCNIYSVNWHINNESKFVFGDYTTSLDISKYKLSAISIGYRDFVLPLCLVNMANNISAIEYTESETRIII